jgi:hypothetical protein
MRIKDELLENMWREFREIYFLQIEERDLKKLDLIEEKMLGRPEEGKKHIYADWQSFLAVYVFYEPIRRLVLQFDEEELNEMYFENLLKHYYITIKSYYEVNFGLKEVLAAYRVQGKEERQPAEETERDLRQEKIQSLFQAEEGEGEAPDDTHC